MTNASNSTRAFEDWQAMSRRYWDAWNDATRKAFETSSQTMKADATPWHEGLEQWSRMFTQQGSQSETMERLLAGAKSYFALLQSLAAKSAEGNGALDARAWTDTLRESFNFPGADASLFDNPLARALREIAGKGVNGFEELGKGIEPWLREMQALMGLPAFGYLREHQEHYQKFAQAMLDQQQQTNRYTALLARASARAFELFEDKLAARAEPGRQIESVRALYDLWVDAAEDAYAEIALSDEFREVYGALVNAQMRVRKHVQEEVERVATDLGMPTRSEIDSMGKRLHEVRRELKQRDELASELAALRVEIEELKRARSGGAPATKQSAPKRAAPRTGKPAAKKSREG